MSKYFIFTLMVSFLINCASKKVLNHLKFDEKANSEILYGDCNHTGLQTPPFNEWFNMEFGDYQPDMEAIGKIEANGGLSELNITIVMGTWCSDSRREVPRFFKIIKLLGYDAARVKIIAVDTKKEAKGTTASKMNIERVPTFIFSKGDLEIGRIIETPKTSLEGDIYNILGEL